MFLYIKNHVLIKQQQQTKTSQQHSSPPIQRNVQRIIPMTYVQYIDYDPDNNELHVKMIGQEVDVYASENVSDRANTKRVFYDIVKDARANGKVIEW